MAADDTDRGVGDCTITIYVANMCSLKRGI